MTDLIKMNFLYFVKMMTSINSSLHLERPTNNLIQFISLAQKMIKKTNEKISHKKKFVNKFLNQFKISHHQFLFFQILVNIMQFF